jgi:hypothetical protein
MNSQLNLLQRLIRTASKDDSADASQ